MFEDFTFESLLAGTDLSALTDLLVPLVWVAAAAGLLYVIVRFVARNSDMVRFRALLFFAWLRVRSLRLSPHLYPDKNGYFPRMLRDASVYYRVYVLYRSDPSLWDKGRAHLRKAGEEGRTPMPLWARFVIGGLTLAESVVFAMVIAEQGLDGITPNQQPFVAFVIGAVLATVLMLATHFAGKEWHRNNLIKRAGALSREHLRHNKAETASVSVTDNKISLHNDHLDDDRSAHEQIINRVNMPYDLTPDWFWTRLTVAFIAVLMLLSFTARLSVTDFSGPAYAEDAPPVADMLSAELAELDGEDGGPAPAGGDEGPGLGAVTGKVAVLLILTLIFLGIQGLSIYLSREYGFVGIDSARAYEVTKNDRTREEFINRQQAREIEIATIAQSHLNALQQRIFETVSARGTDQEVLQAARRASEMTFLAYVQMKAQEKKTREYEDLF